MATEQYEKERQATIPSLKSLLATPRLRKIVILVGLTWYVNSRVNIGQK